MKKCPKNCGMYQDYESKCPVCGSRLLRAKDSVHQTSQMSGSSTNSAFSESGQSQTVINNANKDRGYMFNDTKTQNSTNQFSYDRHVYGMAQQSIGSTTNQFSNKDNVLAHYETTGKEIIDKIKVDGFISGIGTGGTLTGIAQKIKESNNATIYALEPKNMSLIKNGTCGEHKIEGIGDEFLPDILDLNIIDDIILISDEEAIKMSQKLATELGIGVGISSGANMIGAILMHEKIEGNIVTIFPDDLKKYITTDLSKQIINDNLISNKIKLLNFEII